VENRQIDEDSYGFLLYLTVSVCVFVCVSVCARERKTDREGVRETQRERDLDMFKVRKRVF
jgi:hypothetical protein